ncbi:MAG: hypothetical protein KGS72_17875 [Cyanobacteria bacterium REEB67]|nr:hypothetical protein [Cyanobacteria bacterium REEB67]
MSNFDAPQTGNDKIQQTAGSDSSASPLVDMANPNSFQGLFQRSDRCDNNSVLSSSGEMMFSNPYGTSDDDGHHCGSRERSDGAADRGAGNSATGDSASGDQSGTSASSQPTDSFSQLKTQLAQLGNEISQLSAELATLLGNNTSNPTDNTSPAAPTTPTDNTTPAAPTTPTDNTTPAAPTTPTDNTTPAAPTTPTDNTTPAAPTTPTDNTTPAAPTTPTDNTSPAAPTTPTDNTSPAAPPAANANGNFNVISGQIIGPDGKPFDAKGVAVYAGDAPADAATIMQQMPNLNFIRLAANPNGGDDPASVQADIKAFQDINPNIVVEVEDHTSGGTDGTTNNTLSGQDLANEEQWYSQVAANNVGNSHVWFGTANEPNDPGNEQNVVDQEVGIYNAVRSTGNNSMVMLEAQGGGAFAPQQADPGAYAAMTNVAWDDHYYGWETNGDNSVQGNVTAIQNEVAGASGITESNGMGGQQAIPTIIGEYGNSTTGQGVDSNATGAVDGVQAANNQGIVQGAIGWVWNAHNSAYGDSDAITQDGTTNTITNFGQEIINYNNTGSSGNAS